MADSAHRWIVPLAERPAAGVRLYLFPVPGAGASFFTPLAPELPPHIEPLTFEMPGRGSRRRERPVHLFRTLVREITEDIRRTTDARPAVFFGHCAGAIVAFETARALVTAGLPGPRLLVASASPAPPEAWRLLHRKSRPDRAVTSLWGERRETADLWLLALRLARDVPLIVSYRYRPGGRLGCPVSLCVADRDRLIPRACVEEWRSCTSATTVTRVYPGGHMYLRHQWPELARHLTTDTAGLIG
ncbi:thioesterase II family protein [Streptomyces syringium]|uniref:thioesterase II family protein n=1 Tax=Streptomyces syringium TaxID=76729 RepID=UPI0037D65A83